MNPQERLDRTFLGVIGFFSFLHVQVIGFIPIAELIFAASVFFIVTKNYAAYGNPAIRVVLVLLGTWLCSAIATDLYRGSYSFQFLRGWSRVIFFSLGILCLYPFLLRNPGNIRWYLLGALPSTFISLFAFKGGAIEVVERFHGVERSWDRYFSLPFQFTLLALAAWLYRRLPWTTILILLVAGTLNIALGSRSGGAILVLGALTGLYFHIQDRLSPGRRLHLSFWRVAGLAGIAVLSAWGTLEAYRYSAAKGWLGEEAQKKYEIQSQSNLGLLLGGRLNVVVAALAVKDSPIIGLGSWPEDRKGYWLQAQDLSNTKIFDPSTDAAGRVRILAHSYLLEGWVEHGLPGGIFWMFVLGLLLRFAIRSMHVRPDLIVLNCLLLAAFGWNIFFSPLGNRPSVAAFLCLFLAITDLQLTNRRPRSAGPARIHPHLRHAMPAPVPVAGAFPPPPPSIPPSHLPPEQRPLQQPHPRHPRNPIQRP